MENAKEFDKNLYYSPNKMLSYNRLLNFIIGARGIGKSYSMKVFPVKRFLKTGEQFIYVRRYKTELKKISKYFDAMAKEFPDHKFKVKGREFYIDGKLAGEALPLSSWQSEKSNEYPNVTTIIFDEFIRQKDIKGDGYLPNEVDALLNLMDTVFRNRENSRVICLSNAVTTINPYFVYFGVLSTLNINKRFNAYEEVLIEIPESIDFTDARRKTRFGKLIDGTDYADMALDNEFTQDVDTFIEARSKDAKFQFSIQFKGETFGVWADTRLTLMYLCNEHDPSSKDVFALSMNELSETNKLISNYKDSYHMKKFVGAFKHSLLRFDNQKIRTYGYEMLKKMKVQ